MKVEILKGKATGILTVPPSKSVAHRALIAAALSNNNLTIKNIDFSSDIIATLSCLQRLGFNYEKNQNMITFKGFIHQSNKIILDCNESGSTLRFLIPIAICLYNDVSFTGTKKLMSRGLDVYFDIFDKQNISYNLENNYLQIKGNLHADNFKVIGNVSSQFITGLLLALPLLDRDSTLEIIPPLESKPYIDITLDIIRTSNLKVIKKSDIFYIIKGNYHYDFINNYVVEGDYSNSAFFAGMNIFGSNIILQGLKEPSYQGDKVYVQLFEQLQKNNAIIDIGNAIDLGPVLFAVSALLYGGRFINTARLAIKESNRAAAMAEELSKIGVDVKILDNEVIINSKNIEYKKVTFNAHNDHRIAMALSIICMQMGGAIEGAEAVKKSFPEFFKCLEKLGIGIKYEY